MADGEPNQRITVSLETLRQEIRLANAELELRLKDGLASKVELVDMRIQIRDNLSLVKEHERWITGFSPLADALQRDHDQLVRDVSLLKTTKAEDIAVKAFKRYLIGGSLGVFMIMVASFALTLWSAFHAA